MIIKKMLLTVILGYFVRISQISASYLGHISISDYKGQLRAYNVELKIVTKVGSAADVDL